MSIFSLDNSHHSNNYQYYDVLEGFRMVLTIAVLLFPVSQHGDSAYGYHFPIVLLTLQIYVKLALMKDHDAAFIA